MLVAAKCTQCGANIQIDPSHEAGICPHCGTAFITEKAVNNYNVTYMTTNTYNTVTNIQGGEVHIHNGSDSAQALFDNIRGLIEKGVGEPRECGDSDEKALYENLEKFMTKYPLDKRRYEIDALLALARARAGLKPSANAFNDILKLKKADPENGERYYSLLLDAVNRTLSAKCGRTFSGDMLDLKLCLQDVGAAVPSAIRERREFAQSLIYYERKKEEYEKPSSQPRVALIPPHYAERLEFCVRDLLDTAREMLKEKKCGYDGEYLLYLYGAAQQLLVSDYRMPFPETKTEEQSRAVLESFSAFSDAVSSALSTEDRARTEDLTRQLFSADREEFYREEWDYYGRKIGCGDKNTAFSFLRDMVRLRIGYAAVLLENNFKKGLFGIKYTQKVPDRDAQELTRRSIEYARERFKE